MARWVAFVLFILTGLVAAYCLANYWFVTNLWRTPLMLLEAPSPTGFGKAIFARESAFVASSVYLFVSDPVKNEGWPLYVAGDYASDGSEKMANAVWSADGSVIAVRARVGESMGHGFAAYYGTFFVAAYDFQRHTAVGQSLTFRERSQRIRALLARRGGAGRVAVSEPYATIIDEIQDRRVAVFRRQMPSYSQEATSAAP